MADGPQQVKIERPVYEQEQLRKDFEYQKVRSCGEFKQRWILGYGLFVPVYVLFAM